VTSPEVKGRRHSRISTVVVLARSVWAQEGEDFAGLDLKGDVVDSYEVAVSLHEMLHPDGRLSHLFRFPDFAWYIKGSAMTSPIVSEELVKDVMEENVQTIDLNANVKKAQP